MPPSLIHNHATYLRIICPLCTDTMFRPIHPLTCCADVICESFIPDDTLEVTSALGDVTRWYTCSKGHTYGIGNCGQPYTRGQCPDCGEPIGAGERHYAFPDGRNAQQVKRIFSKSGRKILVRADNDQLT